MDVCGNCCKVNDTIFTLFGNVGINGGCIVFDRFCQELELHKEEVLSTPIMTEDGTVDVVAMATRRRIFWSIVCIDM